MSLLGGVTDFFGLDIGSTGLRAVQLKGSGTTKSIYVYGQVELDNRTANSDAPEDQAKLGDAIKKFVSEVGVSSNNVAVGVPTSKVFTTVVDMQRLNDEELASSIKYQANSIIPTPIEESKIDWAVIGDSPKDPTKAEVILSSVSNAFVEKRLDMLESIGLNVIAFEPDALSLARALVANNDQSAQMIMDLGNSSCDIVVCYKTSQRLSRSIQTGSQALIRATANHLSVDEKQATQFLFKFGLTKDKLEGKVNAAVIDVVDSLISEVEKTSKFFKERYNTPIEKIIVTGAAAIIPEIPVYIANRLGLNVEIGNAWTNVTFPQTQQNELMAVANRYAVAVGLAERQV